MRIVCGVVIPDNLGIVAHGAESYNELSFISKKITVYLLNKFKLVAFLLLDVKTRKLLIHEFSEDEVEMFMCEVFRGNNLAIFVRPSELKDYLQFAINHEVGHVMMGSYSGLRNRVKQSKFRTYLDFYSHYLLANDELRADTYAFYRSPVNQSIAFKKSLEKDLADGIYDGRYIDKVFTAPEQRIRNLEKLISQGQ